MTDPREAVEREILRANIEKYWLPQRRYLWIAALVTLNLTFVMAVCWTLFFGWKVAAAFVYGLAFCWMNPSLAKTHAPPHKSDVNFPEL